MKASEAQARAALDRPGPAIRLYLLHGPDEAGAHALAARLAKAMGPEAERIDLDGATLKADPARLADEAAALSLFGGARHIRVTGMGDESLAAVNALLAADRAGAPVVGIAPTVRTTSAIVKLALAAPAVLCCACYVPEGRDAEALVADLARAEGLRPTGQVARRLARAAAGDRAVMGREIAKLALYLDAAPDRPATLDDDALDAIGADRGEAEAGRLVAAIVAGRPAEAADEIGRLADAGVSAIPWLRQLGRRLASLAQMRAEIDRGDETGAVMKRHRVFFREEPATRAALDRWTPAMLAEAHDRLRVAERAIMASGTAGEVIAAEAAVTLARRVR